MKTIAAVATALSNSGISIIRVSGDDAVDIVDRIFVTDSDKRLSGCASHTINHGYIVNKNMTDMSCDSSSSDQREHLSGEPYEVIDEVLVSVMKAPHSYTGEDVVEINTHGGVAVTKKVLDIVLRAGASIAEPGEFSKRAFLNGKMDLSQAEAVMDIIEADNNIALKNGISQLRGDVAEEIEEIRDLLIREIAHIEASNDDPEHIDYDVFDFQLDKTVLSSIERLEILIQSFEKGRIVRNGLNTVILGKPNAGKSSLMNNLLGTERAIVTDIAGTTRDSLEESLNIGDVTLRLTDTAGIRETTDRVESLGVDRSKKLSTDADLILYVVDSSVPLSDEDEDIIRLTKDKKMIVVYNKTDLEPMVSSDDLCKLLTEYGHSKGDYIILPVSLKDNTGVKDITDKISEMFGLGAVKTSNEVMLTNIRHKEAVSNAVNSLKNVMKGISDGVPVDCLTIDLMDAYSFLGYVIGKNVDEDLIDNVFSRFCLGK